MNLKSLSQRLAAVDLDDIVVQQKDVVERLTAIDAALDRGRRKTRDLGRRLAELRDPDRDGADEAAVLLAGGDTSALAETEDKIAGERAAIQAGLRTLTSDGERLRRQRGELEHVAKTRLGTAADPLAAEMRAEAEQLVARLAQLLVDAETLRCGTASQAAAAACNDLRHALTGAIAGRLISPKIVAASPDMVAVLQKNTGPMRVAATRIIAEHRIGHL